VQTNQDQMAEVSIEDLLREHREAIQFLRQDHDALAALFLRLVELPDETSRPYPWRDEVNRLAHKLYGGKLNTNRTLEWSTAQDSLVETVQTHYDRTADPDSAAHCVCLVQNDLDAVTMFGPFNSEHQAVEMSERIKESYAPRVRAPETEGEQPPNPGWVLVSNAGWYWNGVSFTQVLEKAKIYPTADCDELRSDLDTAGEPERPLRMMCAGVVPWNEATDEGARQPLPPPLEAV